MPIISYERLLFVKLSTEIVILRHDVKIVKIYTKIACKTDLDLGPNACEKIWEKMEKIW